MSGARPIRLLQDILRNSARERPGQVALICEGERFTYSQLDAMSDRLANAFCQNGVRAGDRIVFYLLNGPELVVSIFAALKANAVFCSVDYANTLDTLSGIAADCQAGVLVTHQQQAEPAARLMGRLSSLRCAVLCGPERGAPTANTLAFDAIQRDYSPTPPVAEGIGRDLAYLLYTSGSTGRARGVMTTHQSSLATVESGIEYFGLSERDTLLSPLHLSFSPGMNQLLKVFHAGGTLILEKSFAYPAVTLKRMAVEGVTAFAAVPTILALLLQADVRRYDLSRLRYVSSVGAALAPGLIRQFRQKLPNTQLYSFYGMAEAAYCLGLPPDQVDQHPDSVGKPFPGTQAWILDEDGHRLGPDQVGQLVVRGNHVRSGYWNDPTATADRFRPGPLPGELVCFSGDMFRTDPQGYFYFVARGDEVIKSGAKKVAPREIENVLQGMPEVLEAAAIGIPDPVMGQVIKAFVVPTDQGRSTLTVQTVLRHCQQFLEDYKVPRQLQITDSLPKNVNGKIQKTKLT